MLIIFYQELLLCRQYWYYCSRKYRHFLDTIHFLAILFHYLTEINLLMLLTIYMLLGLTPIIASTIQPKFDLIH